MYFFVIVLCKNTSISFKWKFLFEGVHFGILNFHGRKLRPQRMSEPSPSSSFVRGDANRARCEKRNSSPRSGVLIPQPHT